MIVLLDYIDPFMTCKLSASLLCLMVLGTFYAKNYTGIIGMGLSIVQG